MRLRLELKVQDATNVFRVLTELGDQDVLIETNGRLDRGKRWPWMGLPGEVRFEEWMSELKPLDPNHPNALKKETVGVTAASADPPNEEASASATEGALPVSKPDEKPEEPKMDAKDSETKNIEK